MAGSASDPGEVPGDCHPKIREIVDYWGSIPPVSGLPSRRGIDPTRIFRLLPDIRLIDVVGAPPRFRVRLTGENIRQKLGQLQTGRFLDEVVESFAKRPSGIAFLAAVQTKRPYWDRGVCDQVAPRNGYTAALEMERVVLPLAEDGVTVDALLVLVVFRDTSNPLPPPMC